MTDLDERFSATLVRSPNEGGWTDRQGRRR
jgi:hypothetical protein